MAELSDTVDALIAASSPLPPPAERRRLREAHGLTQDRVAAVLRVRRATVSDWEAGKSEPRQPEREEYARLLRGLAERHPAGTAPGPPSPGGTANGRRAVAGRPPSGPPAAGPRMIAPAEFPEVFAAFEHSAWRLESRRRYAWHERQSQYRAFATGRHVHWDLDSAWCRDRRRHTALGKRVERVRVVDEPCTEGQLYLLLQNTPFNAACGEDIRFLTRGRADDLGLPRDDFWILDARTVARLHIGDDGEKRAVELITEPADVLRHVQVRETAWHHAMSQERMADRLGV
ncbi:DUF6879 family protein [Streptomyces sp. NPDC023723]|uniref:helix-turn-helix domain-containing protein n=1 Tax=Streptomyces sp. NPDC023723 TaxID=3154323 RepID=UPI0034062D54